MVTLVVAAASPPAGAATMPAPTTTAPATTLAPAATTTSPPTTAAGGTPPVTSPQLNTIQATLLVQVEAEVGSSQQAVALADAAVVRAHAVDQAAAAVLAAQLGRLDQLQAAQQRAALAVQAARTRLAQVAVASYESGGPASEVEALLGGQTVRDYAHRRADFAVLATAAGDALRGYLAASQAAGPATLAAVDAAQHDRSAEGAAAQRLAAAAAADQEVHARLHELQAILLVTSDAVATPETDIPRMVLDAYQRAALAVQGHGCALQWWGLAGIGRVESDHGRDGNAHLAANGDLLPPIVGVPLNGQDGTALIPAPGGGDARAEGPMQFIPSTWAQWGADGNGDGVKDPNNIYDATLAAARYLCATSPALSATAGLDAAYFSYNHSQAYVDEVMGFARAYEVADAIGLIPAPAAQPLYAVGAPGASTPTTVAAVPGAAPAPAAGP